MKNIELKSEIENNLVNYYANSITSSDFVNNHIRKFVSIDKEKEEKICDVLAQSQRGWDNIECDAEGATKEQDAEMDKYLEEVTFEILEICSVFDFNERVVWDSGFGYEIGYFLGEGTSYDTWLIDVKTGLIVEPCSHSKSEVFKYTTELINKLTAKYGYEKRFSELF